MSAPDHAVPLTEQEIDELPKILCCGWRGHTTELKAKIIWSNL